MFVVCLCFGKVGYCIKVLFFNVVLLFVFNIFKKMVYVVYVSWIKIYNCFCGKVIMISLVCFLVIGFNVFWNIVMYYKVYVWFVDIYIKCNCCNYNLNIVLGKIWLYKLVLFVIYVCMIGCGIKICISKFFSNIVNLFMVGVVNNVILILLFF